MRFSVLAIVATVAAVTNAQSDLYPFAPDGPCVTKCLLDVGRNMFAGFTDDPTNPNFMESLSFGHSKGTSKYISYMSTTGPCIGKCPQSEQEFYLKNYPAKQAWYDAKVNGGTAPTATATGPTTSYSRPAISGTSSAAGADKTTAPSSAASVATSGLVGALALLSAVALL